MLPVTRGRRARTGHTYRIVSVVYMYTVLHRYARDAKDPEGTRSTSIGIGHRRHVFRSLKDQGGRWTTRPHDTCVGRTDTHPAVNTEF